MSNIIDFTKHRQKKQIEEDLTRGRIPLYVSHGYGKIRGSPHDKRPTGDDFADRLLRIRTSLEKINRLMTELKALSNDSTNRRYN